MTKAQGGEAMNQTQMLLDARDESLAVVSEQDPWLVMVSRIGLCSTSREMDKHIGRLISKALDKADPYPEGTTPELIYALEAAEPVIKSHGDRACDLVRLLGVGVLADKAGLQEMAIAYFTDALRGAHERSRDDSSHLRGYAPSVPVCCELENQWNAYQCRDQVVAAIMASALELDETREVVHTLRASLVSTVAQTFDAVKRMAVIEETGLGPHPSKLPLHRDWQTIRKAASMKIPPGSRGAVREAIAKAAWQWAIASMGARKAGASNAALVNSTRESWQRASRALALAERSAI